MPTVREMFQNMTVSSPGGEQRRGAPIQMMGTEVGAEKSPSADGRGVHNTSGRPGRVCGVTERPGSSICLFCPSFVSNKQNKEATERSNRHIERF